MSAFKMITRFFWWCGGANVRILEPLDSEHARFFSMGATIVFTALMATFSGGYAFFTAFDSIVASVFFGIFWGLMIFNLDRYMVITIGKGDGTTRITKAELKEAWIRILMALILGFVIATPLELRLFKGEILAIIEKKHIEARYIGDQQIRNNYSSELEQINKEIDLVRSKTHNKEMQLIKAENAWIKSDSVRIAEWEGRGESKRFGDGPVYKIKEKVASDLKIYYETFNKDWATEKEKLKNEEQVLLNRKEELRDKTIKEVSSFETVENENNGLVAQLSALRELPNKFAKILIALLFIIIEIAPVMFKLMNREGPYDWATETERYKLLQEELNKRVQYH